MAKIDIEKKEFFEANSKRYVYQERLKKGCAECGEKAKRWLSFHHRNPKEKLFDIASGLGRSSITRDIFDLELEKCDVLCIVCHKRKHKDNQLKGPPYSSDKRRRNLDRLRNKLRLAQQDDEEKLIQDTAMYDFWEFEEAD